MFPSRSHRFRSRLLPIFKMPERFRALVKTLSGKSEDTNLPENRLLPVLISPRQKKREAPSKTTPKAKAVIRTSDPKVPDANAKNITFTMSVIALAANLAKIDGNINRKELSSFWEIFPIPDTYTSQISLLFAEAHADTTPPEYHAKRIARMFTGNTALMTEVIESLLKFAAADGVPSTEEMDYILCIAKIFNIGTNQFTAILYKVMLPQETDPYLLLGVGRKVSASDLKKAYHYKIRYCHPDALAGNTVIAKELLPVMAEYFTIYTRAYEIIRRKKQLR